MLFQVGDVAFEVAPFNTHQTSHASGASFAEHAVVGARPPLEFMGEAPETMSYLGRLFPKHDFGVGGLEALSRMMAMCAGGQSQVLMRGDGTPLGWYVIESIRETSTFLDRDGVGRVIEFEISLKRSDAASADGQFNALWSLFS